MNGFDQPRKTNDPCSAVRFDQAQISVSQFRALVSCLNQKQEITPIESWVQNLPDSEWEKGLVPVNSLLLKEPALLYSLRETYLLEKKKGKLDAFLSHFFLKIDGKKSDDLVAILKNHESWLASWMNDNKVKIEFPELIELAQVKSFQRLIREQYQTENLGILIESLKKYHTSENSLSVKSIFELFSEFQKGSILDPESAENFSRWINWILTQNRLKVISTAARKLETTPIQCFRGGKQIAHSLEPFLQELTFLDSIQTKDFFLKTLPSLILTAKGYCDISEEILGAVRLFQEAAIQPGFSDFITSLQPLVKKEDFKKLLLSQSFLELTESLSKLNDSHLFQDILPVILWLESRPLIRADLPELLDSILDEFDSSELLFLAKLIPENKVFYEVLAEFFKNLPSVKKNLFHSTSLTPFTHTSFARVIDLAKQMHSDKRLVPVMDELLELFKGLIERGKPVHQKKNSPLRKSPSRFASWELENLHPLVWTNLNEPCTRMDFNFNPFQDHLILEPSDYWKKINELSTCFGQNRSFRSTKDLIEYSLFQNQKPDFFNQVTRVQDSLINIVFQFPSEVVLNFFESMIQLDEGDRSQLQSLSQSTSRIFKVSLPELHSANEIRSLLSRHFLNPEFFKTLVDLNRKTPAAEDQLHEKLIPLVTQQLPMLFQEYCPELNSGTSPCQIESDQVELYRKSKTLLAQAMIEEYLRSGQSWIHPREFNGWTVHSDQPKKVNELNYHLNPLLKQFENHPKAVNGIFEFLKRNRGSHLKLKDFLVQKSTQFSVIPYVYQQGDYPEVSREFKDLIRLKIINEIDRIELLAINADFMPFGLMKNFGMSFIREIALSWGDLPASQRPALSNANTLAEARESILHQYSKFNLEFIQKWGNCEKQNRNRLASWFQKNLCKGEFGDIRSRMFNLHQTLPVIDDADALILLRDLFYSFYASNESDRFDVFVNGLNLRTACMSPGTDHSSINDLCRVDLLETIPQIARTGVLHQASLSIARNGEETVHSLIKILDHASDPLISKKLISFMSHQKGLDFLLQLIDLGLDLDERALSGLASVSRNLGSLNHQGWILFLIQLTQNHPQWVHDLKPLLQRLFEKTDLPNDLSSQSIQYLSRISSELSSPNLTIELSRILNKTAPLQKEWIQILDFDLSKKISPDWLMLLSAPEQEQARKELSAFIKNKEFDDFCDVLSDSPWVEKAYNILEESHQNSGVLQLIHHARLFLH